MSKLLSLPEEIETCRFTDFDNNGDSFCKFFEELEMTEPEGLLPPEVLLSFDENDTWRLTDLDAASTDGDSGITAE